MSTNLDKYKEDLDRLIATGHDVRSGLVREALGKAEFEKQVRAELGDEEKIKAFLKKVPDFKSTYQSWYSEALVLVKQLLPDRLADFVRLYEKPKNRKDISFENYRIEDALQGLRVTLGGDVKAETRSALPHMEQQIAIVLSIKRRFESSLFDIKRLVQADLFDSELDASKELLKNKFARAAGAIAGVVLEKHLAQVCDNHSVAISKKHPSIADLNDALKASSVIDVPQWRFVQHLGDLRNLCDHNKSADPTPEQVEDLIVGVLKITKTVY